VAPFVSINDVQQKYLNAGHTGRRSREEFGFLLQALNMVARPHGGLALVWIVLAMFDDAALHRFVM